MADARVLEQEIHYSSDSGAEGAIPSQFTVRTLNSEQEEKHLCVSHHSVLSATRDLVVDQWQILCFGKIIKKTCSATSYYFAVSSAQTLEHVIRWTESP